MVMKAQDIKVKIVAIAKDEAAYFADWVHHHLHFGFDEIEIHVNRTTDNSAQVLDKICDAYPQVSWQSADWVDMCPPEANRNIQFVVYANAIRQMRQEGSYTHVFFLDIDEFWCPEDFNTSIQEYIASHPDNKAIYFEWINDLGDLEPFSLLPQTIDGYQAPLGKTLLPINCEIIRLRHHFPDLGKSEQCILANGEPFVSRKDHIQALKPALMSVKNAFVYHRAHRSEMEYVSLLYRGRPGNDFPFKNNRTGLPRRKHKHTLASFADDAYQNYVEKFHEFRARLAADDLIEQGRDFVRDRFKASVDNMGRGFYGGGYHDMMKIFHGVHVPQVIARFTKFRTTMAQKRPTEVDLIRDYAIDASKQNIDEAIELMTKALKLRPKGPHIKKMLALFEEKKREMLEVEQAADSQ